MNNYIKAGLSLLCFASTIPAIALADGRGDNRMYEVTITNLTRGQTFTPIMVTSHRPGHPLFTLGEPASDELAAIAEGGAIDPMIEKLMSSGMAHDSQTNGALLGPGESVSINVKYTERFDHVSVTSMLLPTNDGFFAINGMKGPERRSDMTTAFSVVYDAGSELNDELCANIPGPLCDGEPFSAGQGEGFVHVHAGIHGGGSLAPATYDWRNPAAKITIKKMK